MNELIKELAEQSIKESGQEFWWLTNNLVIEKFAELIVEECRTVINNLYHKTPLELCGPLLTVDEEIAKHFYRVKE